MDDSVTREAIAQEQERRFLKSIKEDSHYNKYYDGMFLLFKTGLRVSEFCSLTVHDIDFENNMLHITHQLQRKRDMQYSIEETKTSSGTRDITMTGEVRECLERIVAKRKHPKVEPIIDGYTGFYSMIKTTDLWWHYIGKSIFTMQLDVIIERTDYSCPKLHLISVHIPIAVIWQELE